MLELTLLRQHVADRKTQTLLRKIVARRVPAHEVEDIVQSVVCDALGAARVPERHEDMAAWLVGIAKHKVADHFRKHRAETPVEHVHALASSAAPLEPRDVLARVLADAGRDAATGRTLRLALREGDGESYAELAQTEGATEAALRQRVSRFRRAMTLRWLGAAILLLALGAAAVLRGSHPGGQAISADLDVATRAALGSIQGAWRVGSWSGDEPRVVGKRVRLSGSALHLETPVGDRVLFVERVEQLPSGAERWTFWSANLGRVAADVERYEGRLLVRVSSGPLQGTASLARE